MKAVKTFNAYQQRTILTANYPKKYAERYLYSGLEEETAEVQGKYAKRYRGDYLHDYEKFRQALKKELGDVMWFVAQIALLCQIKLHKITGVNRILDYQPTERLEAIESDIAHQMIKIATLLYDGAFMYYIVDTTAHKEGIKYQLESLIARVYILGKENNLTMEEILNANLGKLQDRKKRGVIKGSGDER